MINRLRLQDLSGKSPFEILYNIAPSLQNMRTIGYLCFVANLHGRDKFSSRFVASVMIGYSSTERVQAL